MQSKTKYDITPTQIEEIFVRAGLGSVKRIEPLSGGLYNNVLAVMANDCEYVLKVAPNPTIKVLTHERGLLKQELRLISLINERTRIRVPKVYFSDFTKSLIPCDYFIMEKLGGVRLDRIQFDNAQQHTINNQINEILEEFHAIVGEGFGYEQMGLLPNWYLALRHMTEALIDDCHKFGKRCRSGEKLLQEIDAHRSILETVPSVLVNFDLHEMNLFYKDGTLSVIDLERCYWGDWIGDCLKRDITPPKNFSYEEKIRFYLLMGHLSVIMYTEKYSRCNLWMPYWWKCVKGSRFFWRRSIVALKQLSNV